jgi:hypothetical protein
MGSNLPGDTFMLELSDGYLYEGRWIDPEQDIF